MQSVFSSRDNAKVQIQLAGTAPGLSNRAGGDSGVLREDDDDDDDPCISRSSPECHGKECDHGAEGGHDHFHLRARSSSSGDFRSKSSLRIDRYKCFGLLESNILNSLQLQKFRRKIGSGYDSANSPGRTSMIEDIADTIEEIGKLDTNIHSLMYKSIEVHKVIVVSVPWRPPRTG
ncbi:hypothetical protein quinque_003301 [Culex quinquefasciatus]